MATADQLKRIENGELYPLLQASTDEELAPLVDYILNAATEMLSIEAIYKQHNPKHSWYADLIGNEIRSFGGNSIANLFRGGGPEYAEVVADVCSQIGVKVGEGEPVAELERKAITKIFSDAWERMDPKDREAFCEELRKAGHDGRSFSAAAPITVIMAQAGVRLTGFLMYRMAIIVANAVARQILGRGLTFAANATLSRTLGLFAGPIGWAVTGVWTAVDLAGPAYRVTIPCVLHVGYLRQKRLYEALAAEAVGGVR
ncbi:ubiquinol-cytochrome C chaperone family protein [Azospirillum sp. TSO35-2]|uniref:YaaW family protein n=1 Tax=Azospirillum sp. TSO35-2 TaxID=716796 RepID=UPI0013049C81|nr:ubiquinol-cytochrome C chaperone family protein [Azospirillum sp. TSO35-2]